MSDRIVATFHAYNLDEARVLLQAGAANSAICLFQQRLRSMAKHGPATIDTRQLYEEFLAEFGEFLGD